MKLVDQWHHILLKAWSCRLIALGFLFQVLEQLLPYFDPDSYGIPPTIFRWAAIIILVGAVWARVIPQPQMNLEITNANQQDKGKQPRRGRHRRSHARTFLRWLAHAFFPGHPEDHS
ncbi:hypothetical protein [Mesorhizobium sp.]|uniref:DUF7940 domain-containing protein n=1 Tax=Mesorhizobium sp. TaxID=1871066 RepID=UPI0025FDCC88|nr:hypothetical protein [Mesorhizobium sp.]